MMSVHLMNNYRTIKTEFEKCCNNTSCNHAPLKDAIFFFIKGIRKYYDSLTAAFAAKPGESLLKSAHKKRLAIAAKELYIRCLLCVCAITSIVKNDMNLNLLPFRVEIEREAYNCSSVEQMFDIFAASLMRLCKFAT